MLPRAGRLRKRQAFQQVYEKGQRVVKDAFMLYANLRGDDQPSRIGFVAGRRFDTHAQRNRAKRRLRAVLRPLWHQIAPGYDLVVVAREPALQMPFPQLCRQVQEALESLQLLSKEAQA